MDKTPHTHLPWGPVSLAFFGVAFARVWLTFAFVAPGMASGAAVLPHDVFDFGYTAVSVAAVVLARRIVPLSDRRGVAVFVLLAMAGASACSAATMFGTALPFAASVAGAVAGGVAYGIYLLLNAEAFAGVSLLRIVVYLAGSRVLASALVFLLVGLDAPRMAAVLFACPCIAVALTRAAYASLPEADRQRSRYPRFTMPWKLLVLVGVFSFAYGLRQATLATGAGQHSSLSTGIAMGAVFVLAYFFSNRVDVALLCRLPLPIMACGLLLVPAEGLFGQTVSSYLVSIGYTLATFSIALLFYDMAKRTGVAIVALAGAMNAMQIFVVGGNYASRALDEALAGGAAASVAVTCLVVAALAVSFFLLFSERELTSRWGIKVLEESSLGREGREADRLEDRCAELTRVYGLTSREDEVLRELARRKDNRSVATNLLIAPGTLKAHTRHIYEKMGIHTRAELDELLGLERP